MMKNRIRNIARNIDGNDVMIVAGMSSLGYGLWLISAPAALITVGGLLLGMGAFGALRHIDSLENKSVDGS